MQVGALELHPSVKLAGLLLGAVAVTACSSSPTVVGPVQESSHVVRSHPVYVVNHGWHAGLILPARHLNQEIPELKQQFGATAFYEIGWGDQAFYQAQHKTADLGLQALFRSKGSVLHVVAIPDFPAKAFNHLDVVSTCLTKHEMASVAEYVANSFYRSPRGSVLPLNQGLYGNSRFFAGTGSYSFLNTCNTWIAKGLQSAGMDLYPSLTLTSARVISVVRSRRQRCTPRPHPTTHSTIQQMLQGRGNQEL